MSETGFVLASNRYGGGERSPLYNRPRVNVGYAIFAAGGYEFTHIDRLQPGTPGAIRTRGLSLRSDLETRL